MNYSLEENLKGLNEASNQIFQNNKAKGFWDSERNVCELLMLVTSELGEAMEAHRKNKFSNWEEFEWFMDNETQLAQCENTHGEILVDLKTSKTEAFNTFIKDTFEDEIADAVIRLMDLSAGLGIDLEKHISEKVKFNTSRPKLHGKAY